MSYRVFFIHNFRVQYEIDGRDPNGYVGCMWSICGVHDQVWVDHSLCSHDRDTSDS